MATRKQRRRKHDQAVAHQRQSRERLCSALDAARRSGKVMETMQQHGYEIDWKRPDKWRPLGRVAQPVSPAPARRGPSWAGIVAKRKRKAKRT